MKKDRSIRSFRREDAAIYQAMAMDFYGGDATLYPMTAEKLRRSMDMALSHPDRFALHMLVEGEEVVGYMALTFCFSTEAGERCAGWRSCTFAQDFAAKAGGRRRWAGWRRDIPAWPASGWRLPLPMTMPGGCTNAWVSSLCPMSN